MSSRDFCELGVAEEKTERFKCLYFCRSYKWLKMERMNARLISGRTIAQGQNLDNKLSEEYFNAVAICEMNEKEMEKIGVSADEHVEVRTSYGEVVVKAKEGGGNPEGISFITMGPWANAVVSGDTQGAGMPQYKGIDAEIEKSEEEVLPVKELMQRYMG